MSAEWLDQVKWDERGLVTAIAQDAVTGRVLMVAWMNREALAQTAATQTAVYFSRSRSRLWRKGEESGHTQRVKEIRLDCDGDVILLQVEQVGGIACHTGRASCMYLRLESAAGTTSGTAALAGTDPHQATLLWRAVDPVLKDPKSIYTDPTDL
jgi:phosphoribosyl-AMP cyclohydrolase